MEYRLCWFYLMFEAVCVFFIYVSYLNAAVQQLTLFLQARRLFFYNEAAFHATNIKISIQLFPFPSITHNCQQRLYLSIWNSTKGSRSLYKILWVSRLYFQCHLEKVNWGYLNWMQIILCPELIVLFLEAYL